MSCRLRAVAAGVLLVSTVGARAAAADPNLGLWEQLPPAPTVDVDDALAHAERFRVALALDPGLSLVKDAGQNNSLSMQVSVLGAYGVVHEAPKTAYALRLDNVVVTMAGESRAPLPAPPGVAARTHTAGGVLGLETAEGEARLYVGQVEGVGRHLPLFAAVWGGLYGAGAGFSTTTGTGDSRLYLAPLSLSVGVGVGRLLPITPRIVLAHIEKILTEDGVLAGPIPEPVADAILRMWVGYKNELGLDRRALTAMKLLHEAGLATGALTVATAYRVERMIAQLSNSAVWMRTSGFDTRLAVRVAKQWGEIAFGTLSSGATTPLTLALELRSRHVANLSMDSELWFEPALGWAPRTVDEAANVLPGNRRVSLLGANADATAFTGGAAAFPAGALVLDIPLNYTEVFYDAHYNTRGVLALHAGAAFGLRSGQDPGAAGTVGAAYTFLTSGVQGYKVGLDVGLG
ncbi:MAG TPA: hypothetical protein VFH51_14135, partial [Myxococcota bacterium]|nr:hypothetical protein [Myxococcota bacterium]